MKWTVGTRIGSGYALALIMLIFLSGTSYNTINELMNGVALVEKTQEEMILVNGVVSIIIDAESAERGYLLTGEEVYLESYNSASSEIANNLNEMQMLMKTNPVLMEKLDILETVSAKKLETITNLVKARKESGEVGAKMLLSTGTGKSEMDEIKKAVESIKSELDALLVERQLVTDKNTNTVFNIILFGLPLSVLVLIAYGITISRSITIPLKKATGIAVRIAAGDLTSISDGTNRQDELGILFKSLDTMIGSLRDITREIIESASVISSSSSEIMASTAQVASGVMETSVAVSQTTSSVEEVKQSAQMANDKARDVSDVTRFAVQASETGLKSLELSVNGMNRIQNQVESIGQSLSRLSEQSQAIGEITASVNDLAEQSNLLAVNAAIEAAKAGEQGKGFAVVAQEVKILAEQSKEATAQVRTILNDILKAINSAVLATELGGKAVEAGVEQSKTVGDNIQQMADSIGNAAQLAVQIAVASQQQLTGMDQIAQAMENIRQASVQNVSGTKQVEDTMQGLHELGQRLKHTVERYKL